MILDAKKERVVFEFHANHAWLVLVDSGKNKPCLLEFIDEIGVDFVAMAMPFVYIH